MRSGNRYCASECRLSLVVAPALTSRHTHHLRLPDGLRAVLHRAIKAAGRRKALVSQCLPIQVAALDGKATALPKLNHPPVQNHMEKQVVRFDMAQLSASQADRPCIPLTGCI
jgi:hypothetical protein